MTVDVIAEQSRRWQDRYKHEGKGKKERELPRLKNRLGHKYFSIWYNISKFWYNISKPLSPLVNILICRFLNLLIQ